MKVNPKEIQYRYRQLSDAELRSIRPSELTPVALLYYREEISARGFETNRSPLPFNEQLFEKAKALGETTRRETDVQSPPLRSGFHAKIEEITARYQGMTDEALLRIQPRDLTREALSRYMQERARRGLPVEPPPDLPPQPAPDESSEIEALLADARIWKARQQRPELPRDRSGRQPGIVHALLALAEVAIFLKQRQAHSTGNRCPVLWLRRFHSPREDTAFKALLAEACGGLATVVTIQDETVSYSSDRGFERFSWLIAILLGVIIVANFFPFEQAVFVYLAVFAIFAVVTLVVFVFRGLGLTNISGDGAAEQITEVIRGIRRGVNAGSNEPLVVKCSEENWQSTVATAEALCDAIVMDVSDLSANMEWELGMALRLNPSESVIFVCGIENGVTEGFQSEASARVAKLLGSGGDEGDRVFFFPLKGRLPLDDTNAQSAQRLQLLLAKAIVRKGRMQR